VKATSDGAQGAAEYTDANGDTVTGAVLTFDALGAYKGSSPAVLTLQALGIDDPTSIATLADGANVLPAGADGSQRLTLNYQKPTQFSAAFEVTNLEQNGLTVGRLTGVGAREFAWKLRCAVIKSKSSVVKLTFDCSNADELIEPNEPDAASPAIGIPDSSEELQDEPVCDNP
jgi:hypothetical protein